MNQLKITHAAYDLPLQSQALYIGLYYCLMSVQAEMPPLPKPRNRKAFTIYCQFSSKESFICFRLKKTQFAAPQRLTKIKETEKKSAAIFSSDLKVLAGEEEQQKAASGENCESSREMESLNQRCAKCAKVLQDKQNQRDLCSQCFKIQRAVQKGSFIKFVKYVLQFKKKKLPSYNAVNRVKRIESIESCQSFILDKADSSVKHSLLKHKALVKESSDFKNPQNTQSIRFRAAQNSTKFFKKQNGQLSSTQKLSLPGGYFCNECQAFPIQGRRFHCLSCSDYDLCQKCYFYMGHKHQVKVFKQSKEEQLKKVKQNVLIQSQFLKSTLPLLSHSIQEFESMPKLFTSYKIKNHS